VYDAQDTGIGHFLEHCIVPNQLILKVGYVSFDITA
jgi:hypothetical protein